MMCGIKEIKLEEENLEEGKQLEVSADDSEIVLNIEVVAEKVEKDDVLIAKFPAGLHADEIMQLHDMLALEFPENKVLCMVNDIEVMKQSRQDAIELLERMLAHIRIVT